MTLSSPLFYNESTMWIYFRPLLAQISKHFIRGTIVATVLFITFGLFLQWGFPNRKQETLSVQDISLAQEKALQESFKNPIYQTPAGKQVVAIEKRIYCSLLGSQCTNNPADQVKNYPDSLFGNMAMLMIQPLMHPPASGIAYIQHSFQDAGFITRANAAEGVGFTSLRPFLPVWKAFRNMAYMILVIVIIVLGFMIMFQYKIDSHTIISVQSALPRIVIALLVITFSYAIAGLMIDLMYVIILLIFQIFSSSGLPGMDAAKLQDTYLTSNILSADLISSGLSATVIYSNALTSIYILIPTWLKVIIHGVFALATTLLAARMARNGVQQLVPLFGHFTIGAFTSLDLGSIAAATISLLAGLRGSIIIMGLLVGAIMAIG
ncbi:MAG: hypothetical protein WBO77_04055, partial [Microgenomates group bacterium]